MTGKSLEFLHSKIGERIFLAGLTQWHCYSADLSTFDFYLLAASYGTCHQMRASTELKSIVHDLAVNMIQENIQKIVRHAQQRLELRRDPLGRQIENLLKNINIQTFVIYQTYSSIN